MYETEDEITTAIEAGDAVAADIWAFALKNQLKDGGKKALDTERNARGKAEQSAKDIQRQLDEVSAKLASSQSQKPADAGKEPEWKQQLADMRAQLDAETEARTKAEARSAATERIQHGVDKGLPTALAKLLVGVPDDELDARVEELLPLVKSSGPQPNPQQANPSKGKGGTLAAGAALYEKQYPKK